MAIVEAYSIVLFALDFQVYQENMKHLDGESARIRFEQNALLLSHSHPPSLSATAVGR